MRTPFDAQGDGLRCHCPGMGEFDGIELCACPAGEKVIRGYMAGLPLAPMTVEQRAWCLDEIGRIEGYDRAAHEGEGDGQLARTVLCAWTDFCRDKGLM